MIGLSAASFFAQAICIVVGPFGFTRRALHDRAFPPETAQRARHLEVNEPFDGAYGKVTLDKNRQAIQDQYSYRMDVKAGALSIVTVQFIPKVAQSFGAKVPYFEWCDDFSAARNESLRHANELVLGLDPG